jgi:hypothetical protein
MPIFTKYEARGWHMYVLSHRYMYDNAYIICIIDIMLGLIETQSLRNQ